MAKRHKLGVQEAFFLTAKEASKVKARIVSEYFGVWSNVLIGHKPSGRLAYIDLFAGKGRYDDGTASTPILVLQKAIADPRLHRGLTVCLNEGDPETAD